MTTTTHTDYTIEWQEGSGWVLRTARTAEDGEIRYDATLLDVMSHHEGVLDAAEELIGQRDYTDDPTYGGLLWDETSDGALIASSEGRR